MRFLVSTGYAWNRLRTLVLGLSRELLILANNLNLRFVGNATVITQQIRNAWDSYGLPFPQMLLNGAWLHNELISDAEIVDETPDVDTSRPTHKARALQFTSGSDYVSISKTYPSTDTPTSFEVTLEIITGDSIVSTQDIFCTDDAGQAAGIQLRIENYLSDWRFGLRVGNVVGRDSSFAVETNTRYIIVISYDGTDVTLTVNEATNLTITPTSAIAGAGLIMLGRRYTSLGNYFNGILGYVKIKEDNIVIGEYAFEEGEGTICYNRVMNNFHGTINNATISTFRVEDVRITNGDQGTFLNTDGYSHLNVYTSDFSANDGWGLRADEGSLEINNGVLAFQGTSTGLVYANKQLLQIGASYTVTFRIRKTVNGVGPIRVWLGLNSISIPEPTTEWQTVTVSGICTSNTSLYLIFNNTSIGGEIDDLVVTQTNLYVPRPRVTDIPLYNAGKYGYYIPDDANNFIDLNTAFAGLTNEGDWMEFGIATVGTGEPDSEGATWALSIDGSDSSSFYARIDNTDFRFYAPANGYRMQANANLTNRDFYSFRVTKNYNTTTSVNIPPKPGLLEAFDRDGNLIDSATLESINGNEGTYTFDRFFPQTYGTDFILAYLKLSDGTVWNGANDFNGGVNITNTGTGNVTKIFFESVDEDVLGNPLTYKGQVAQPLSLVNSNGAKFPDGDGYVDFDTNYYEDFTMVWYGQIDTNLRAEDSYREAFSSEDTNEGLFYINSDRIYFRTDAGDTANVPYIEGSFTEEEYTGVRKFSVRRNYATGIITVGVDNVYRTVAETGSANDVFRIDRFGKLASNGWAGEIYVGAVYSDNKSDEWLESLDWYNLDTTNRNHFLLFTGGSTTYGCYDVDNDRILTAKNVTLSDFWIKQDQFHWNLKKGFSWYEQDLVLNGDFSNGATNWIVSNGSVTGGEYVSGTLSAYQSGIKQVPFTYTGTGTLTFDLTLNSGSLRVDDGAGLKLVTSSGAQSITLTNPNKLEFNAYNLGFDGVIDNIKFIPDNSELRIPLGLSPSGYSKISDNPAGKWHNDAETEINFPHTAKLQVINEQFDYKPFFYKNAQLDDATAAYSMRKVIADYEGPLLNVIRSSDLQAQDFYPDSRGDLDTTAITNFVNESGPVLDDYAGAAAAYSLRKLRTAYTGDAIEVRRSSNGDTQDIGFDSNGDLDTTALTTFVGSENLFFPSETFTGWGNIGGSTITSNTTETNDPFGGSNATKVVAGSSVLIYKGTFTNVVRTETFYAKAGTCETFGMYFGSGFSANFNISADSPSVVSTSNTNATITAVGDGWYRCSATLTSLPASDYYAGVNFSPTSGTTFYIFGAQLEGGTSASEYNKTTTGIGGDGAVTTWYDQSGSNNATQSNPDEMPLVVSGGTLVTENSKAAVDFDGVDDGLVSASNIGISGANSRSIFTVVKPNSNLSSSAFIEISQTSNTGELFDFTSEYAVRVGGGNKIWGNSSTVQVLLSLILPTGGSHVDDLILYENGSLLSDTALGDRAITTVDSTLKIGGAGRFLDGKMQELIVYPSDQSSNRTDIEGNIGRYYNIDGFTDGRVATWYDQANANHATQATPDNQPLVVSGGSVLVDNNGKAKIQATAATQYLTATRINPNPFYAFYALEKGTSTSPFNGFTGQWIDSYGIFFGSTRASVLDTSGTRHDVARGTTMTSGNRYLISAVFDNDIEIYQDGTLEGSVSGVGDLRFSDTSEVLRFFSYSANNSDPDSCLQEVIIFNSDKSGNREDIEKNIADYYDITISGNAGVESWVKNVSFADMYQSWYDYEYLHKLFANFEVPNQVNKILAYVTELTIEQRETIVYPYLKEDYHPIYTPYQQRVQADSGDTDAGKTNTLNKIDNI